MSTKQSKKPVIPPFNPNELYASALELDPALSKELDEQGLVGRWINSTEFQRSFGFHKSRWQPYKRKNKAVGVTTTFAGDPEGHIRRGDLILAVKTKEEAKKQRLMLNHKADLYKGHAKTKADELRKAAREAGVKTDVDESYEMPGEEVDDSE